MVKPRVPRSDAVGLSVPVRVRPGAGRTRVGGRYDGPHGPALVVAVGAPAVDGKGTEAVRRALADALGVRPGDVTLRLGATTRDKVFSVAIGDGAGAGGLGEQAPAADRLASTGADRDAPAPRPVDGGRESVAGGPGLKPGRRRAGLDTATLRQRLTALRDGTSSSGTAE